MSEKLFTKERPSKFAEQLRQFITDTPQALHAAIESLQAGTFAQDYPYVGADEEDNWCVVLDELLGTVLSELQDNPAYLTEGNDLLEHLATLNSATDESFILRFRLFAAAGMPQEMMADYMRIAYEDTPGQAAKVLAEIYGNRVN